MASKSIKYHQVSPVALQNSAMHVVWRNRFANAANSHSRHGCSSARGIATRRTTESVFWRQDACQNGKPQRPQFLGARMMSSKKRTKQEEETSEKPEPELARESEPKVWLKPGDPPRTLREMLAVTQARVAIDRKTRGRPQTWREVFARARQWREEDLHQGEANQKPNNGSQPSLEGWEKAKKEYYAEVEAKGVPATLRGMREKRKRDVLMELKRDGSHFEKGTWLVDDNPSEAALKCSEELKAAGDAPSEQSLREELHKTRDSNANLASKSGRPEQSTKSNAGASHDHYQLYPDDLAMRIEAAKERDATRKAPRKTCSRG